jgi:hypothetical protein
MDRGRVGEDRGSKETDRCPLTARQSRAFARGFQADLWCQIMH